MRLLLRLTRSAGWLLAAFILANAVGELLRPGFALDHFWVRSVQKIGPLWRVGAVFLAAALLVPEGLLAAKRPLRLAGAALSAGFATAAVFDAIWFWLLLADGTIRTPAALPFSLLVAAVLGLSALRMLRAAPAIYPSPPRRFRYVSLIEDLALTAAAGAVWLLAFIFTYGPTDYTRAADCAVVLGSKAHADGTPSLALYDRTMAAVELYRRGLVDKIVMSGAYDSRERVSEPEVMRRLAVENGVPPGDIILDEGGVNSWATVSNVQEMAAERGWSRVLLVSHYYHLPRLRLAADRVGLGGARTVPCRQTRRLRREPWCVLREFAGLGYYYLFHPPPDLG